MAIGEFDGAATLPGDSGHLLATPMYWFYEMGHAALNPSRAFADATRLFFKNPANPLAHTAYGKSVAASMELFERSTRRYQQAGMEYPLTPPSAASACRCTSRPSGSARSAACCISSAPSRARRAGRSRSC